MPRTTSLTIELADGRQVSVALRRHPNYRNLRLTMLADGSARLSAPERTSLKTLKGFLAQHHGWLQDHLPAPREAQLPEAIDLPALSESWRVTVQPGTNRLVALHGAGELRLPEDNPARNQERLITWLRERARQELGDRLERLSHETGLPYERITIRGQTGRWGSYSSTGTVSLNWKLLFLPRELCDHVLLHELCHSRHMNHSASYWATVASFEPRYRQLERKVRGGLGHLPAWVRRA